MGDSHRHLMITPDEWQAFMDDVQQALDKFQVPQPEQDELKAIVVAPLQEGPAAATKLPRSATPGSGHGQGGHHGTDRRARDGLPLSGQEHGGQGHHNLSLPTFRQSKEL